MVTSLFSAGLSVGGVPELESLSLAFNRMRNEAHENDTLECLDRLTLLDVSNNKLRVVPRAVFVSGCRCSKLVCLGFARSLSD